MDKFKRLWSFDQLIGPPLVMIIYYVGLVGIAGMLLIHLALSLMRFASDIGGGFVMLVAGFAVGAVILVMWRFCCELAMVTFANHEMLLEIRERQRTQYPEF